MTSIPWEWILDRHIAKYGYSGTVIRSLRIKHSMTRKQLANALKKRNSFIKKIENTEKIGIKLAKQLAYIFSLSNYRELRDKSFYIQHKKDK